MSEWDFILNLFKCFYVVISTFYDPSNVQVCLKSCRWPSRTARRTTTTWSSNRNGFTRKAGPEFSFISGNGRTLVYFYQGFPVSFEIKKEGYYVLYLTIWIKRFQTLFLCTPNCCNKFGLPLYCWLRPYARINFQHALPLGCFFKLFRMYDLE